LVQAHLSRELEFELTGGPYAVTAARLALSEIDQQVDEALAFDVRLLVSELVTNSVRHADIGPEDSILLKVALSDASVRVEVVDTGPGFELPDEAEGDAAAEEGGWGIFFVKQLADRYGADRDGGRVWFEIDRHGGEQAVEDQTAA